MPSHLLKQIHESVDTFCQSVKGQSEQWASARDAAAVRKLEQEVHALARGVADEITEHILRTIVSDPEVQAATSVAARTASPGRYRHGGRRPAKVTLLSGREVEFTVEYLKPNRRGARKKRGNGRRGKSGSGLFPVLAALGFWFGVSPALAGEVCRQVTDSDSVRTGRSALARRGIVLGHGRTLRIVNETSQRASKQRQAWLTTVGCQPATAHELSGKRVVVALDGGRLRERKPKQRGRRRKKTGHRSYDAPWREPKQLVIYVVDNRTGKVDDSFCPVYDATLGDCDAIVDMLVGYLKALGAHKASRLIVVGDGAKWIWERTARMAAELELPKHKLVEVIDWFHAVEVLHAIANVSARLSTVERDRWIVRAKRALHRGDIERVATLIDELAVGRQATEIAKHRDYFIRNVHRMQYSELKRNHLPLGSGAVESAIRRVVNQRLKGCGTFWLEDSAEGMLLLRSYLKCGRFDDLIDWSLLSAASWWPPGTESRNLSRGPLLHTDPRDA